MLTKEQINEIKDHLERAQNPIFYYDNDADGLCSFLILRRFLGRGKGVAVRSYPDLNVQYARKARELNADYVFILDKPNVSREFIEELVSFNLPIVWIDHHDVPIEDFNDVPNFFIYNPTKNKGKDKSSEPVTYLTYKITERKEDLWIGIMGCIADHYLPDFASDFKERYSDYWGKVEKPFDAYYKTEIGRIARAVGFGLKDSTSNVVRMQNFLISTLGPEEVLLESSGNRAFRMKYLGTQKKYDSLLNKAKTKADGKLLFFEYGGEVSLSADLSNELSYSYPDKYIVVVYKKQGISSVSMRGNNVRKILEKVLSKIENASGGGHEDAVGARLRTEDIEKFKELFENEIKNA